MKQVLEQLQQAGNFERFGIVLLRAAELARGVNVIYAETFCNDAMSIYNALEVNGYYKIKED